MAGAALHSPGGQGTRGAANTGVGAVAEEVLLVWHLNEWRPATVLWRYAEGRRLRALVRFETTAGLVLRQLRWADELRPTGRVLLLPMSAHLETNPSAASAARESGDD